MERSSAGDGQRHPRRPALAGARLGRGPRRRRRARRRTSSPSGSTATARGRAARSTRASAYPLLLHAGRAGGARARPRSGGRAPGATTARCLRAAADERSPRREGADAPRAVRFRVPDGHGRRSTTSCTGPSRSTTRRIEDFVLLRSDGQPTYHLSVVVDDIDMEITHVVRGDDHISNTPKQILLYRGARRAGAGLRARAADPRPRQEAAQQAARRDVGHRVPARRAISPRRW